MIEIAEQGINPKAVLFARLSEDEFPDILQFDCNDEEMNRFLKEEAYEEQRMGMNSTILLYYKGTLAAFCSICCDSIPLNDSERQEENISVRYKVPAIKIARLGRDVRFRGQGFGRFLINYVKDMAFRLSTTQLGVRFITVDAYLNKVDYYASNGFIRNEEIHRKGNVSMRADIFDDCNSF